jgi:hypothetical protein
MRHDPFASLDDLLGPETLSALVGFPITTALRVPFTGGHSASGSRFLAVETNGEQGPRFVVKLSSPASDWIVRGTADHRGREMLVWSTGLLDQLPAQLSHPVIACAWDGAGWAILMHDVSDSLISDAMGETPIDVADFQLILDALAALHASFWEQHELVDPALGFCSPWHRYTVFSPATGEREADHPNEVIRWIREGWPTFLNMIAPDVATLLQDLLADPAPLCAAMARYPQTVLHGDPRGANLGIVRDPTPRLMLIDWHLGGPGVPAVDLAWVLSNFGIQAPVSQETAIGWYHEALRHRLGSRFDGSWWGPQLELSLLGELLRCGAGIGWDAADSRGGAIGEWTRRSLMWWSERARAGARWL